MDEVADLAIVTQNVDDLHDRAGSEQVFHLHSSLREGGAALSEARLASDAEAWQRLGPSALAAGPVWSAPIALDSGGIAQVVQSFVDATLRVEAARLDVVELHFGYGYPVASFLSPNSNYRDDEWGGDLGGRMRLALEIAR